MCPHVSPLMTSPMTIQMIEAVAAPLEGAPATIQRCWSDAFRLEIAAESLLPGAKISEIARRIGVDPSQIYQWRRWALRSGRIRPVLEVAKTVQEEPVTPASVIEVELCGATVRCDAHSDEAHLRRVLRAVRQS